MSDIKDHDIETRAYAIWEAAGRPEGSHENHWHQAREELLNSTVAKPEIKIGKAAVKKPAKSAKKAKADDVVIAPEAIKVRGKKAAAPAVNGSLK